MKTKKKRSSPSRSNTAVARIAIPTAVKREIRQRCGFGCVICGLPLYEYEHMLEWANVKRHVASEMTLLCPHHHREKTNGLLSTAAVAAANADPINKRGESSPYNFHLQPATALIKIGGCNFVNNGETSFNIMVALSINGEPMVWFRFQDGNLLLNLSVYDEKNKPIARIRDNELVYSTEPWDVTFVGTTLRIQTASRKTALTLTVSAAENLISIDEAKLRFSGIDVDVTKKGIFVGGRQQSGFENCTFVGSAHLLNFGKRPAGVNMCASL